MPRKPEIQYIGQFYVHGSEAKKVETKELPKKKPQQAKQPQMQVEPVRLVCLDPVAICGMAVAVIMAVVLVFGAAQIGQAWDDYEVMAGYASDLRYENIRLTREYRGKYDLKAIESAALNMGMIPVEEAQTMQMTVTLPVPEPEPTLWEDILWFMKGLFA